MDDVPAEIEGLLSELTGAGFTAEEVTSPFFGDVAVTFRRGALDVRVVRDRGQWFIEVGSAGTGFYDADIWRACLEGRAAPLDPRPLAEQAAFVLGHLGDLGAAATDAATADCLQRRGLQRTTARLRRAGP